MKAVRFHSFGGPEVLKYEDVEAPVIKSTQVLVKVDSAGVNFADCLQRRNSYTGGMQLPYTPGFEVSGTVTEAGKDQKLKVGDRVLCMVAANGGYRELVAVESENAFVIPEEVSFEEAAALPGQALTAYFIYKDAPLVAGETVLITAAAGGVGSIAAQIGKLLGGKTFIGTTSTDEKSAKLKDYGYDHAINSKHPDWHKKVLELTGGKGVDLALESVSGRVFDETLKSVGPCGKLVVFGRASGEPVSLNPSQLIMTNQRVIGFSLWKYMGNQSAFQEALTFLFKALLSKELKLQISTYPLSEAARVHELMEASKTTGKLILKP